MRRFIPVVVIAIEHIITIAAGATITEAEAVTTVRGAIIQLQVGSQLLKQGEGAPFLVKGLQQVEVNKAVSLEVAARPVGNL